MNVIKSMKHEAKKPNQWIRDNISDGNHYEEVSFMLIDWELFEGGWVITSYDNPPLFYYLCQIGDWGINKPKELEYMNVV